MHIRPAHPPDFPTMASLSVDCFWHDELYDFTNPHKTQYPDHFRDLFLRRLRLRYYSPGIVFFVAVTDEGDEGHEEDGGGGGMVVGYAVWVRVGGVGEVGVEGKDGWFAHIERTLLALTDAYVFYTRADKSTDYANLARWLAASRDEFAAIPQMWRLLNLCVAPRFQRRGVGALLMAWGKEQAEREGCPVGLTSSAKGKGLYEKMGFRRYATMRIEGFPVGEVPVFLWEPPGLEGRWGEKGTMRVGES